MLQPHQLGDQSHGVTFHFFDISCDLRRLAPQGTVLLEPAKPHCRVPAPIAMALRKVVPHFMLGLFHRADNLLPTHGWSKLLQSRQVVLRGLEH